MLKLKELRDTSRIPVNQFPSALPPCVIFLESEYENNVSDARDSPYNGSG